MGGRTLQTVEVAGGRRVAYAQWGDAGGQPVFSLHGTPGSRLGRPADEDAVVAAGLRVITYDRPGYGASDRQPGRTVVDCVGDVVAIADDLGLDRFYVTGGSGGGPHALALAARLPGRVIRARCIVGVVPWETEAFDWFAGMDQMNVDEFGWALEGEKVLRQELERETAKMLADVEADPARVLDGFDLSESDRAVLADPRQHVVIREMVTAQAAQGAAGWVDDDLAFLHPWGFDLAEITVPVEVRYGTKDVLVPAAHGEWLGRHVPGARVVVEEDAGHLRGPDEVVQLLVDLVAGW